jgi:hypothetical protein
MATEYFNPEIGIESLGQIKERLSKKAKAGYVFQNKIKKEMTFKKQKKEIKKLKIRGF